LITVSNLTMISEQTTPSGMEAAEAVKETNKILLSSRRSTKLKERKTSAKKLLRFLRGTLRQSERFHIPKKTKSLSVSVSILRSLCGILMFKLQSSDLKATTHPLSVSTACTVKMSSLPVKQKVWSRCGVVWTTAAFKLSTFPRLFKSLA
jgi:hypothetical protein